VRSLFGNLMGRNVRADGSILVNWTLHVLDLTFSRQLTRMRMFFCAVVFSYHPLNTVYCSVSYWTQNMDLHHDGLFSDDENHILHSFRLCTEVLRAFGYSGTGSTGLTIVNTLIYISKSLSVRILATVRNSKYYEARRFGNLICFRLQMRGGRGLLCWVP
jgi:hypothetical protein